MKIILLAIGLSVFGAVLMVANPNLVLRRLGMAALGFGLSIILVAVLIGLWAYISR